jgi:HlyD family secretion protein
MKKRLIVVLVVLAAAAAGVYAFRGVGHAPSNRIVVSGNIELTEVNIAFKTAGRLIERNVDEGDRVTKGQVIARLDRDQLVAQRSRETAGYDSSESQLAQAATAVAWQKATMAGDIEQKKADVASNEARLQELKNRRNRNSIARRRTGTGRKRSTRTMTSRLRSTISFAIASRARMRR